MERRAYLYITPYFPVPGNWRGGFCLDAAKALARDGRYEVHVLRGGEDEGEWEADGVRVHGFRFRTLPCELAPFALDGVNGRSFLRRLDALALADVAVCHCHTIFYGSLAQAVRRRFPRAFTALHHHFTPPFHLGSGRLGRVPAHADWLYRHWRRVSAAVDCHVFTSKRSRAAFARDERGGDLRDTLAFGSVLAPFAPIESYVWYNGTDLSRFHPAPRPAPAADAPFVIGCVANFFPGKGQLTLIQAVEALAHSNPPRPPRLRLVGSGPCLADCRAYVADRGLDGMVSFEAERDHSLMPDFYRSLDLYALVSSYREGFNCSCVEAHACGVNVVAAAGTSIEEALDAAWLAPPNDPAALAAVLRRAASVPASQRWKVELDANTLATQWLDHVESAVARRQEDARRG